LDFIDFKYLLELFYSDSWRPWLVIGILFILAELVNLGTLAWFASGISAFVMTAICFFFPDFIPVFSHNDSFSNMLQLLSKQIVVYLFIFYLSSKSLIPAIMNYIYGKKFHGSVAFADKRGKSITHLRKNDITRGRVLFEDTEWVAIPDANSPDILPGSSVEIVRMENWILWVKPEPNS
jgi:membrane-bound ClpP family serine protease